MTPKKKAKEVVSEETTASPEVPTSTFTPTTANIEAALADPNNAVPFVTTATPSDSPAIILPGNAFFDQEL